MQASQDVLEFAKNILVSFSPILKENDKRLFYGIIADNLGMVELHLLLKLLEHQETP